MAIMADVTNQGTNPEANPEPVETTADYLTRRASEEAAKEGRVAPQLADDQQREPEGQQENDDGDGDESGQEPEADEPPDKEADPGEPGEADDGDGGAGDEPGADDDTTSRAVKKRLQRERRKTERILSEKEREIAELRAQIGKQAKEPTEAPAKEPTEAKPPELVDYPDVTSWIADLRRYNAGESTLGPDGEGAKTAPEPTAENEPQETGPELRQQQRLQSYFADLRETLDESEIVSDDEMDDFDARMKDSKIPLSEPMLEWLADNDNSPLIVKTFLEKPRESRRIFRLGTGQAQKAALTKLANAAAQKETGCPPLALAQTLGSKPRAPNIKPVRGRGAPSATDLSEITDYKQYETQRLRQSKGRASGFLIS